jgi:TRAP-type C4-dicarboxylate transport system permease small subunit
MPPTTNAPLDAFLTKVNAQIIVPFVTLLVLAAFTIFIWGVVEYIRNADNDEKRSLGTQHIVWGLVGLTIIFGANAIIAILKAIDTSIFGSGS